MEDRLDPLPPRTDGGPQRPSDQLGRPLRNLRVSVTDRCNLRCGYCMPEADYEWLPKAQLLTFEEIATLVDVFMDVGVERVRLTGGEPLLRRDLPSLVSRLRSLRRPAEAGLRDIAMTTNGLGLADQAPALRAAGLDRLTISLDSLQRERYRTLTRRDGLGQALAGIEAAAAAGFSGTKLNTVVMRGVNDDEVPALVDFARERGLEARFIEYMDVGGATRWSAEQVVPRAEILERIAEAHGAVQPVAPGERAAGERGPNGEVQAAGVSPTGASAPAERFRLDDGTVFGVIASTTAPFCSLCDRARLTADGRWFTCLYATDGKDLRQPLRAGASRAELVAELHRAWGLRTDRGAEERLALAERRRPSDVQTLRRDPHLEMHTRGG